MTAIVGVLNRHGIAFAADSAATHTSKSRQKITNNANKIFALSKYHPVGVVLYNNLDFMGTPWDSIIKVFRDNLRDVKYDTLAEYIESFWTYVRGNNIPSVGNQEWFVDLIVESYHNEVHEIVLKELGGTITDGNKYFDVFYKHLDRIRVTFHNQEKSEEFSDYTMEEFRSHSQSIDKALTLVTTNMNSYPIDFKTKIVESLYEFLRAKGDTYLNHTGLVFFGYGDKELYPSYQEYIISCALDGRYKCYRRNTSMITNYNNAIIAPFAQSDVTNTVIRAVEDNLRTKFYDNYKTSLSGFRDEIVGQMAMAGAPQQLLDILNSLDVEKYALDYKEGMDDYIRNQYINSLIETVAYLGKEDLADMAESLVRMTCIKRRITSTQETVGGPVDVAVVTKGDGFIWMKRKHYFDPQLNPQFFERYNK